MKIGIAFNLKPQATLAVGQPDDAFEEFDSPVTVRSVAEVIRGIGHEPIELGDGKELIQKLLADPPDLVFNFAEGTGISRNREARVPAVCEMLGIPHTGSDVQTLAVCLDKDLCRRVVKDGGVTIPKGILLKSFGNYDGEYAEFAGAITESDLTLPLIAKPLCEGSSKGIRSKCLIEKPEDIGPTVVSLWNDYKQPVLLEEFIAGEEVTVGVLGNDPPEVVGCMRVIPKQPTDRFVYSLEVKRDWENRVQHECPPKLPHATLEAIEDAALAAYDILGCRDVTRIDFRVRDGIPYFIEANPLPGLHPETGHLILIANAMGSSHRALVESIIRSAMARAGLAS